MFLTLILTLAVSVFGLVACGSDGKEEPEKAEIQELSYELNSEEGNCRHYVNGEVAEWK
ncbi:MAG: hypothetical protein SPL13_03675 [Clostridia bacterium]|nr:hypothetical protein [Clostridia bacterium]